MSTLLNIGSSGLLAAQNALSTISHNITNANTDGYSRQSTVQTTAGGQYTGSGFFGQGVQVSSVQRQYDQYLTSAVQQTTTVAAADATRATGLAQLDSVFGNGDNGIGAAMDQLFAAAGDLANRPNDLSVRQAFLGQVQALAQRISSMGGQIASLQQSADTRISQDAASVNARLTEIRQLNDRIAQSSATGQPPNDLLDQRDSALKALNGLMSVSAVPNNDGTISIFTQSGQPLLVGAQQSRLDGVPDPSDASRTAVRLTIGSGSTQLLDAAALAGGSLAGAMAWRDQDLAAAMNQVGRIADVVASALNQQQALGLDMNSQPGAALFSVPGPATKPASTNTGSGALSASVANAGALQPSDYDVQWDGAQYTITRLSDQSRSNFASLPATLDGIAFSASGSPAAGDHWRVQPFAAAATGIRANPLSPSQLATGYAAAIQSSSTNAGSAVALGFAVVRQDPANAAAVTISFPTAGTVSVTDAGGATLYSGAYAPGGRIPPSGDLNGWAVTLDGAPVAGDSFKVGAVSNPGSDNRNALALQGLARAGLASGSTLAEAYAALVGDVGTRVQSGRAASQVSSQLASEASTRQQNVSGVNLDEEAADMLRYQQAYQAAAKIIQASQTVFDALLSATGR